MAKLILNMDATEERFFEDTAMVGIVTTLPGYRFCWLLNKHFEIAFSRDIEQNILMKKKTKESAKKAADIGFMQSPAVPASTASGDSGKDCCFPVYKYALPNSDHHYLLYQLKDDTTPLLPETKHLDFLWLIQTGTAETDALGIVAGLRNLPDVQLAQILDEDQLKNQINLLV